MDANSCTSEGLKKNLGILSEDEKKYVSLIIEMKQEHIFDNWADAGTEDAKKHSMIAQIKQLDSDYPGGLKQYYQNGINLLKASFDGKNPFDGWVPSIPAGQKLEFNSKEFNEMEQLGRTQFANCAFVLVAGGLGERLGYPGIKVELPIEITTETCFLEYYIKTIQEYEYVATKLANKKITLPFAIMTSGDTHDKTVELLNKNNYFGADKDQIFLMKQGKVVALQVCLII